MELIDSVCTYCGVGCDIVGHVKDDKIHKISARREGAVSQGKLCIKGSYGFDFLDSPRRLRTPRIRKSFLDKNPQIKAKHIDKMISLDDIWYESDIDTATTIAAEKLKQIQQEYGRKSICCLGGARSSCESGYLFQKFTRHTLGSPHVDNCARVCHSPSLKGMKTTIGEGAATNHYDDIYKCEFIVVIGSNTTQAHPIVANRMIDMARKHNNLAVIDVREISLHKYAKYKAVVPYEANLLILNMMIFTIIDEGLFDEEFIKKRTKDFLQLKESILNDPYANPKYFQKLTGYESLAVMIPMIAREYASKNSMIFWGLGITEHIDGSYAVMALTNLALLTGNIGKEGTGLMPLRGQNNVQGVCDMGMLPYFDPDYQPPKEVGLMMPQLVNGMLEGEIKAVLNIGEDLTHIHPNLNKVQKAIKELEFVYVQDLFATDIAQYADVLIGVKSAYEKTGVYVNAMRGLSLSKPIVSSDLLDDWEILQILDNKMGGNASYESSEDIWNEVREVAHNRFSGASYALLKDSYKEPVQWPVHKFGTKILHTKEFNTDDGLGAFVYHQYKLRNMIKEIVEDRLTGYYLTTGRTLAHYNNAAQTTQSHKLNKRYAEDILLVCRHDKDAFSTDRVILKTAFGETSPLTVRFTDKLKPKTLFVTFHHARSKINNIFGDESDELILTAAFKSVKVDIVLCHE